MNKFKVGIAKNNKDIYVNFKELKSVGYCIVGQCGSGKSTQIKTLINEAYKNEDTEVVVISEFAKEYETKYGLNYYVDAFSFNPFSVSKETQEQFKDKSTLTSFYGKKIEHYCKLIAEKRLSIDQIYCAVMHFLSTINLDNIDKLTVFDFINSISKNPDFEELYYILCENVSNKYLSQIKLANSNKITIFGNERYSNEQLMVYNVLCEIEEHVIKQIGTGKKLCIFIDYTIYNDIVIKKMLDILRLVRRCGGCMVWVCYDFESTASLDLLLANSSVFQIFSSTKTVLDSLNFYLGIDAKKFCDLKTNESFLIIERMTPLYCFNDFYSHKIEF